MNEKKIRLIEAGMKLFAEKGYHMTSVEEIAAGADVSKGSFYLYFQSKKDFILTAFHYYHQEITAKIKQVQQQNFSPRDSFAKQIEVLADYIYHYKDFLMIHLNQNISIGENTDAFMQQMNVQNFHWLRTNIVNIYGDQAEPFFPDIIIQVEGMISGYFKWIIIDEMTIDQNQLGAYIVRRMDDIMSGLLERMETPLVVADQIPESYREQAHVSNVLTAMKHKIDTLALSEERARELKDVIGIMLQETAKEHPQKVMIQGLLVHFQNMPEFAQDCRDVARLLHIGLLDKK